MALIESGAFPIADIEVGDRLRQVDAGWVEGLAKVIEATGLQHPVEIMLIGNSYRLASGAHRLAAFQLLGRKDIPARIISPDTDKPELELRLHEIAENVGRRELSALDRAAHVAELKEVYLQLHGETRGRKGRHEKSANIALFSLGDDVAGKMGLSRRTIFADADLHNKLTADTRSRLAGHPLADNRAQLVALSKLDANGQARALDLLMADNPQATTVSAALSIIDNKVDIKAPDERDFAAFLKLWARASRKVKRQIKNHITKEDGM